MTAAVYLTELPVEGKFIVDTIQDAYAIDLDATPPTFVLTPMGEDSDQRPERAREFIAVRCVVGEPMTFSTLAGFVVDTDAVLGITPDVSS